MRTVVAVDLGASSGRVMVGRVGPGVLDLTPVARFDNVPVPAGGTLYWDVLRLYRGVLDGLRAAGPADSVGIDTWGVDYGLLDADGALLGNPVHYRDGRTDGVLARVLDAVPAAELYAATGTQFLPFNTLLQLVAAAGSAQLAAARTLLLLPDLFGYWLTGTAVGELTNASTTQLLDLDTRGWSTGIARRAGIDPGILAPLVEPGHRLGPTRPGILPEPVPVTVVASHDTASAVVGVPARDARFGYISCGTWSLVGVELDRPIRTDDSRAANFTNELGVDGTVRYLRNVMGLWLLQECLRGWEAAGLGLGLDGLLRAAAAEPALASVIDADDPALLPPGDMPARIAAACRQRGEPVPETPAAVVRCILDSLALAHRRALADAQRLSGHDVDVVHVIGGGARNALLCQLTADACGLPVDAGPVEATALGNVLLQARALGAVGDGLAAARSLLRDTQPIVRYRPTGQPQRWERATARAAPAV